MDRGDQVRPALARLAEGDDRACRDRLGAIHVGVDDVRADLGQVRGQGADRDRVVGVVDDQDGDAGPLQLAHGAARRQRDDRHVVARGIHPGDERVEVLLGAAVGAGREDLDDPDAAAAGELRARRPGRGTDPRARARSCQPFRRRTSIRWIGSSSAPHSYLYGSLPRRKSSRRHAGGEGAGDVRVDHHDARRQVARVRVHAGVVVEDAVARSRNGCRRRSAGRRPSGTPGGAGRRRRTARTGAGRRPGSARRPGCRGTGRGRPTASGAGR